ncbi:C40 family peptidase [Robertkochia sediminum]|uniref:C40 family peptidase n=1 Tax=Robertkochia sediminum TaxID=2785326 RepID=UPI001933EA9C|nr:C40 family peptidase [Robertkochia sediminum]MBL7472992.1 C40 family peptidase [Robertkochia sediminum]
MRSTLLLVLTTLLLASCGGSKKAVSKAAPTVRIEAGEAHLPEESPTIEAKLPEFAPWVNTVIHTAMSYHGTRYKYGGTTRKGMDCSGLIYTSFGEANIDLERTSAAMAQQGEKVKLKEVQKGDLLFFNTGRGKRINHVGLVVEVDSGEIRFIHSTTSRGVLVSSLREGYWNHAFNHARRIM